MFDFFSKEDKQLYNMLGHLNMAEKEIWFVEALSGRPENRCDFSIKSANFEA